MILLSAQTARPRTRRLGDRLALRSAVLILAMVSLAGLVFLFLARAYTDHSERTRQLAQLQELLDTVSSTVSIAIFLEDQVLATEVARGLLENRTVNAVSLWAGDQQLAQERKPPPASEPRAAMERIEREVLSPFVAGQAIGSIVLEPNPDQIQLAVDRASNVMSSLLLALLALIGAGVVAVVMHQITRPILRLSTRLHGLQAETGEKLDIPPGHASDEIGRLVRDVNSLTDRLVQLLRDERQLRAEREREERRFRVIFEASEAGIFQIDAGGTLKSFNPAFRRLFGLTDNALTERSVEALSEAINLTPQAIRQLVSDCLGSRQPLSLDFHLPELEGVPQKWVSLTLSAVEDDLVQGVANDITARKRNEEAVAALAVTDPLTGLHNRLGFNRKIDTLIAAASEQPAQAFTLLMIDLDRFKPINDTLGHAAGDKLLTEVAGVLRHCVRRTDFIARLGGDEFVVLLEGTVNPDVAAKVAGKILQTITRQVTVGREAGLVIGASIGIAMYGPGAETPRELTARADHAMYRAKQDGRSCFRFHADPPATEPAAR